MFPVRTWKSGVGERALPLRKDEPVSVVPCLCPHVGLCAPLPGFRELLHQKPVHADQGQLEQARLQRARAQNGPDAAPVPGLQLDF